MTRKYLGGFGFAAMHLLTTSTAQATIWPTSTTSSTNVGYPFGGDVSSGEPVFARAERMTDAEKLKVKQKQLKRNIMGPKQSRWR